MLIDAHCHAYGFREKELEEFSEMKLISVAEDLETSIQNVKLSKNHKNIIPFAGIHPWNIEEYSGEVFDEVVNLVRAGRAKGLGEVGIDKRFRKMWNKQLELFEKFCSLASELDIPLNIHALNAWSQALTILRKYSVKRALFHWYSGPIELLKEIEESGYYISINPSIKIQPKHRRVLEKAGLDMILTESDGPYRYRGMLLKPSMIRGLLDVIADVNGVSAEYVEKVVERNLERFLGRP